MNRDLYSVIYNSDYNIANLKEIAKEIRKEQKIAMSFCQVKNLLNPNFKTKFSS